MRFLLVVITFISLISLISLYFRDDQTIDESCPKLLDGRIITAVTVEDETDDETDSADKSDEEDNEEDD